MRITCDFDSIEEVKAWAEFIHARKPFQEYFAPGHAPEQEAAPEPDGGMTLRGEFVRLVEAGNRSEAEEAYNKYIALPEHDPDVAKEMTSILHPVAEPEPKPEPEAKPKRRRRRKKAEIEAEKQHNELKAKAEAHAEQVEQEEKEVVDRGTLADKFNSLLKMDGGIMQAKALMQSVGANNFSDIKIEQYAAVNAELDKMLG
jgi:outer membrane biosynthesis protein TonB